MLKKLNETVEYIRSRVDITPEFGLVLGSGLGGLVEKIEIIEAIPYTEIPNFPVSTVKGHGSNLVFGKFAGKNVVVLQGRFHYYEGYSMQELTFPIRILKMLGISTLILSNASGGVNPDFQVGDIMIIDDHINLMQDNPLIGPNIDELGPRFPDMSAPYNEQLIDKAMKIAKENSYRCHKGVYVAVSGPCYETPAEYKYVQKIGGDAVGMSTVPEVIVARHMELPVFAVSIITDLGGNDHVEVVSHEEVLKVAKAAESKMTHLVEVLIEKV